MTSYGGFLKRAMLYSYCAHVIFLFYFIIIAVAGMVDEKLHGEFG